MNYNFVKNEEWQEAMLNGTKWRFPTTWFVAPLGDIAKTVTGNTPSTTNKRYWAEKVGTPWFSTPDFRQQVRGYVTKSSRLLTEDGVNIARMCPAKTLLVSCIATIGEVGLLSEVSSFNQQINGVLPNDKIDTAYFRQWFIYKASEFKRFAPTSVVPIINKSLFNKFEIILPPLVEQTAIANILSDQESLIAHCNDLIALHENRFAYLSDELLSGRLRLDTNVDSKICMYPNTSWQTVNVNGIDTDIPREWKSSKLKNELNCLDSKRKPLNSTERSSRKGTIPYWGANSIVDYVDGYLLDEDVVLLGEDAAPFFDKSKKVAFASQGKIWPNNHVHVLKAKNIDMQYSVYVLNNLPYEEIIGVTPRPKLTQGRMLDIDLVVPVKIEQTAIANVLSDQEALIANYKTLRDAEKKRFDWLSDALLSGTYRVKVES